MDWGASFNTAIVHNYLYDPMVIHVGKQIFYTYTRTGFTVIMHYLFNLSGKFLMEFISPAVNISWKNTLV